MVQSSVGLDYLGWGGGACEGIQAVAEKVKGDQELMRHEPCSLLASLNWLLCGLWLGQMVSCPGCIE